MQHVAVPGDFSSAAFFVVAALLVPQSEVTVQDVGLNPTRPDYWMCSSAWEPTSKLRKARCLP